MKHKKSLPIISATPKLKGKNALDFIKKSNANSTKKISKEDRQKLTKSMETVLVAFSRPGRATAYMRPKPKPSISKKRADSLYASLHSSLTDLRIELVGKITPNVDFAIAQVEHKMWKKMKDILGIS